MTSTQRLEAQPYQFKSVWCGMCACGLSTHDVDKVHSCGCVQVPVQLVQDDPLHTQDLSHGKAAAALNHQVSDGAQHLVANIGLTKYNTCSTLLLHVS